MRRMLIALLLVSLVGVAAAPARAKTNTTAEEYNALGLVLLEQGDFSLAVGAFSQAVQLKPKYAEAYFNLADALGHEQLWPEAIETFKKAVKANPRYAEAYLGMAEAYRQCGKRVESIDACKRAIAIKSDYANAYNLMGLCLFELGRTAEAIDAFHQTIRLNPGNAVAYFNLGMASTKIGKLGDATSALEESVKLDSDSGLAFLNLGLLYQQTGAHQQAVDALRSAIIAFGKIPWLDTYLDETYLALGRSLEGLHRDEEAIEAYGKSHSAEASEQQGWLYCRLGRYDEAIDVLFPLAFNRYEAKCALGMAYAAIGNHAEAVKAFKLSILVEPNYAPAHYGLGASYVVLGEIALAVEEAKTLKQLDAAHGAKLEQLIDSHSIASTARNGSPGATTPDKPKAGEVVGTLEIGDRIAAVWVVGGYVYITSGNKGLTIVDVSDHRQPKFASQTTIRGEADRLCIAGNYAYIAARWGGLQVVDISDHAEPRVVGSLYIPGLTYDVRVSGETAYVLVGGLNVVDVSEPTRPKIIKTLQNIDRTSDLSIDGNRAYVVGWEHGVYSAQLDGGNSKMLGEVPCPKDTDEILAYGDFLFCASEEEGLLVFDVSNPARPIQKSSIKPFKGINGLYRRDNLLYVNSGRTGIQVWDITDPLKPAHISTWPVDAPVRDLVVSGDYAYAAAGTTLEVLGMGQ